jgi:hypothetical protein
MIGESKGEPGEGRGSVQPYHFLDRVDAYVRLCQLQSFWLKSRTVTLS